MKMSKVFLQCNWLNL